MRSTASPADGGPVLVAEMGNETSPLLKYLIGATGLSRRKIADAIRQGRVEVNRQIAEDFRQLIRVGSDTVKMDGKAIKPSAQPPICLMLNKPTGFLTTSQDDRERRTVMDLLPGKYQAVQLHVAGRLDMDSSGLLLLTNDGDLTYRITHPKFEHEKEYWVDIAGYLKAAEKRKLEEGIQLEDGLTHPARIKTVRGHPPYDYSITIHEGRKRQVRRMFEALGYRVRELKRVRIGNLLLGDLPEGQTRELSASDIKKMLAR